MAEERGVPDFFCGEKKRPRQKWLQVRMDEQKLYLWRENRLEGVYPVSTAAAGPGCRRGSGWRHATQPV